MSNSITAVRCWANEHIYRVISTRYANLKYDEKQLKCRIAFKRLMNIIRDISTTTEIDKYNTPMAFLFQHLLPDIIKLVANCATSTDSEREYILRGLVFVHDWNIRFFQCLIYLDAKDILLWFFFHIPYYIHDITTVEKIRINYEWMLDYFVENLPVDLHITFDEFIFASNETWFPYALAYHNSNNAIILAKYSKLIRKLLPWVNYFSPRIANKLISNNKFQFTNTNTNTNKTIRRRRICFISDSFNTDSSVLRDRIGIIGKIDKSQFDIWIASFNPIVSYRGIMSSAFIKKYISQYITLSCNLEDARKQLEVLEIDIIIYADLGMKVLPTLLAYSRIAPVQITTWGHSETSGIDTIDYYISSRWFDIRGNNVQSQQLQTTWQILETEEYTERLVLFDSLGTYYFSPQLIFIENAKNIKNIKNDWKLKTREQLGLPDNCNIYCCLQTFYKIMPEFEKCLARILEIDRTGILLLSNAYPYCKSHLQRMQNIFDKDVLSRRVIWYEGLEKYDFLNLVAVSDVCLDPFPFGGCNTTYEAFDFNIPVITFPSNYLHGRFTLGLYSKMGMNDCECIVSSSIEYAEIASHVAMQDKLKNKIKRSIETGKSAIFQEWASVEEWNSFLNNVELKI